MRMVRPCNRNEKKKKRMDWWWKENLNLSTQKIDHIKDYASETQEELLMTVYTSSFCLSPYQLDVLWQWNMWIMVYFHQILQRKYNYYRWETLNHHWQFKMPYKFQPREDKWQVVRICPGLSSITMNSFWRYWQLCSQSWRLPTGQHMGKKMWSECRLIKLIIIFIIRIDCLTSANMSMYSWCISKYNSNITLYWEQHFSIIS